MSFDFQPACVHMVAGMKTSCHNRDKTVGKSYIWAACSQSRTCCLIMWLDIAITTWLIINLIFSVSLCFSFFAAPYLNSVRQSRTRLCGYSPHLFVLANAVWFFNFIWRLFLQLPAEVICFKFFGISCTMPLFLTHLSSESINNNICCCFSHIWPAMTISSCM